MIGIYKITNKNDGKVYIGQSENIERRLSEHKQKRNETIDDYINVLGVENFDFEIIEECDLDELDNKEQEYIMKYDSRENGYNIQNGGFNNSQGEGNGRAKLTEKDIVFIRESYANHLSPSKIYEEHFKDKITKSQFQGVWQGRSWTSIMPEVYTTENKQYYISGQCKTRALLTNEEVMKYRQYYVNHTREEVYQKFLKENGNLLKKNTFIKILTGDVRNTSIYKEIPIYKKSLNRWELNGEPVSTILGSEE
jgi:group I intron endonuclease